MAAPTLSPTGIRTDLVERLAGKTSAGARVFDSRRANYESEELPAITVTSLGGSDERWAINALLVQHVERLAIVGDVTASDEAALAAALDTLEGEILDAVAGDPEWVGAFDAVQKVDCAKKLDNSGEILLGHVAVVIEVHYPVEYSPVVQPANLRSVHADTHSADPAGADVSKRPLYQAPEEG